MPAETAVAPEEAELEEPAALVAEGAELVAEADGVVVDAEVLVAEEPVVLVEEATVIPDDVVGVPDEAPLDVVEFVGIVAVGAAVELLVVDAAAEDSDAPPEQAASASADTTRITTKAARFSSKTRLPLLSQPEATSTCRMKVFLTNKIVLRRRHELFKPIFIEWKYVAFHRRKRIGSVIKFTLAA